MHRILMNGRISHSAIRPYTQFAVLAQRRMATLPEKRCSTKRNHPTGAVAADQAKIVEKKKKLLKVFTQFFQKDIDIAKSFDIFQA